MMLEEKIHRILAHPIRRRILSSLSENEHLSFSQLKKIVDIDDHGKLAYHLKSLDGIVEPDERVRGYRLTEVGQQARVLLSLRKLQDLMEIIRFTENVSTMIHGAKDKAEIFKILREASQTTSHSLVVLLPAGDGARLRIPEGIFPHQIIREIESESNTAFDDLMVHVEESTVFNRVVRDGETIRLDPLDLLKELIPGRLISRMKNASDLWKQSFILVPLNIQEDNVGVFAMSSPILYDPFIPSVRNLAEHVSTALKLVEEHAARIRAEEEIRREKEFTEALINSSVSGILAFDMDCRYTLWSKSLERMSGKSKEEILGEVAFDIFPILVEWGEDECYYRALSGEPTVTENRYHDAHETGRERYVEGHYSPLLSASGEVIGGLAIVQDVTEKVLTERALRRSESKFLRFVESSLDGISLMDERGVIIEWNQSMALITGLKREDALGNPIWDIQYQLSLDEEREHLSPDVIKEIARPYLEKRETPWDKAILERDIQLNDGERKTIQTVIFPIQTEEGSILGNITRDVTEQKLLERGLRESEEKYRTLWEDSSEGLVVIDREDGRILDCNVAFTHLTGHCRLDLQKRKIWDLRPQHLREDAKEKFFEVREKDQGSSDELCFEKPSGEIVEIEFSSRATIIDDRPVLQSRCRDISERKRREEEMREVNFKLGERVKELHCLYGLSQLINRQDTDLEYILGGTANLIPPAWQHPESTCARIVYRDRVYRTDNFMETAWCQSANILVQGKSVGAIEVYRLEQPKSNERPFLREEQDLIAALAERLGRTIERIRVE